MLYQRLQIPNQTETVRQQLQLALQALGQQANQSGGAKHGRGRRPGGSGSGSGSGSGWRARHHGHDGAWRRGVAGSGPARPRDSGRLTAGGDTEAAATAQDVPEIARAARQLLLDRQRGERRLGRVRPVSRLRPPMTRSSACSMVSTVSTPKPHGTPVSSWTCWIPRAASVHT